MLRSEIRRRVIILSIFKNNVMVVDPLP